MTPVALIVVTSIYFACVFAIGYHAQRWALVKGTPTSNALVYTLSLGVYCTAWTMFGGIGSATSTGMLFLSVAFGPALGALFWWFWLRKLIRSKNRFRITSLADWISARYNRSVLLGVLASVMALVGFLPYVAVQIRSMIGNAQLMMQAEAGHAGQGMMHALLLVFLCAATVLLGLRRIDQNERRPEMIMTLAFESTVKLTATLVGGIFIVYYLHDGILPALQSLPAVVSPQYSFMGQITAGQFMTWLSQTILSLFAAILLPWQFHVAVIENSNENHIKTAQWGFPLYLLLMNLLVLPIAIYGLQSGLPAVFSDSYLLMIPLVSGHVVIATLVYLGGLSAGLGMIVVMVMALSTMLTNQLLIPLIHAVPVFSPLRRWTLGLRWLAAIFLILIGYLYQTSLGEKSHLASMGMISFVMALQFAPAILGGLYWREASSFGAMLGLGLGFLLWILTLMVPQLAHIGLLPSELLEQGFFGFNWLRPEALFGLRGLDPVSHAFVWTSLFNVSGFFIGSLLRPANEEEIFHAQEFLETEFTLAASATLGAVQSIPLAPKFQLIEELLGSYFDVAQSRSLLGQLKERFRAIDGEKISVQQLANLISELEKLLAGAIGTAAAHSAIKNSDLFSQSESLSLASYYASVLSALRVSPAELAQKIDYQKAKEALLAQHALELEAKLHERTSQLELSQQKLIHTSKMASLGGMAAGLAHEVNTPLAIISLSVDGLREGLAQGTVDPQRVEKSLQRIQSTVERIAQVVRGLKMFSRGGEDVPFAKGNVFQIARDTLALGADHLKQKSISIELRGCETAEVECRAVQISQVLLNLLTNSVDAIQNMPSPWIDVVVEDLPDSVKIVFTDSGPGIPSELARRIMEPFFTTKEVGKGTGLGLSISMGIIESHGGKINLEAQHTNTRFVIYLPKQQKTRV